MDGKERLTELGRRCRMDVVIGADKGAANRLVRELLREASATGAATERDEVLARPTFDGEPSCYCLRTDPTIDGKVDGIRVAMSDENHCDCRGDAPWSRVPTVLRGFARRPSS